MSIGTRWLLLASALLLAGAAAVVLTANYSSDLSAFLPRKVTPAQALLVEQLRDGPLSRTLLIAIEGSHGEARALASKGLAARLRADPAFSRVDNGTSPDAAADQRYLFDHRYVLSPAVDPDHFSIQGLTSAIGDLIDALASPVGAPLKPLLASDPTGEMLAIIEQFQRQGQPRLDQGVWVSPSGQRALLLAQTRATGADTDAQAHALDLIHEAFRSASATPLHLIVSGPGVFAVAARGGIEQAVSRLGLISAAGIFALLFLTYRSLSAVALGLVPVVCGALTGVAAVALGFGTVHGITLGFGATLIGEAVDYSIYLFVQSRSGVADPDRWPTEHWPIIRLGMFTSVIGFASLLPSSFPGLAQLGLYSIAGLLCAGLVTRFLLPSVLPAAFRVRDLAPLGRWISRHLPRRSRGWTVTAALALMALGTLVLHRGACWNRELAALSPVPLAAQQADARLRAEMGAAEAGVLVAISAGSQEAALQSAEQAGRVLDALRERGVIGGYDSPALFLPSLATQRARREALPAEAVLRERTRAVLQSLPLNAARIDPFFQDVEAARNAAPLTRKALEGTSFASAFDALCSHHDNRTQALLPLHAPAQGSIDLVAVRAAFHSHPVEGLQVLDLKQASDDLYGAYLQDALKFSGLGLVAICALLALTLRNGRDVLRVLAPLAVAVMTTAALLVLAGQQLTILHLVGMLLVVAIGSNYALFFVRMDSPATLASLLIANLCTVIAFGALAFSTVPVLAALGRTVAPGAWLALCCSALLWGGQQERRA